MPVVYKMLAAWFAGGMACSGALAQGTTAGARMRKRNITLPAAPVDVLPLQEPAYLVREHQPVVLPHGVCQLPGELCGARTPSGA